MKQVLHPTYKKNPVPVGRHGEWKMRERPDADRLALKIGKGIFSGDTLWSFPSRQEMNEFLNKQENNWIPVIR